MRHKPLAPRVITTPPPRRDGTCFFEADPDSSLARRAAAEAIGSFLLVFTGASAALAWAGATGFGPIGRALAVGPALTGLILVFGQVSGGHYNPLISVAQWFSGRRATSCLFAYVSAQLLGASLAAWAALATFHADLASRAPSPPSIQLCAAEAFATAGLMIIVLAAPRMRPAGVGPFAVGGWVAMSIVALPSGPTANPAITLAAVASGLARSPTDSLLHLLAQAAGLALAMLAISLTSARPSSEKA